MKAINMDISLLIGLCLSAAPSPATAQLRWPQNTPSSAVVEDQPTTQPERQAPLDTNPGGHTAGSSVGQVGQRQTRELTAQQAGIEPMARIAGRVQNRVQNRIRNRIDRYYNTQANATDPFIVAGEQARRGSRTR